MLMSLKEQLDSYNKDQNIVCACSDCNGINVRYYEYEETDDICAECGNPIIRIIKNKVWSSGDVEEARQSVEMAYNKKYREGCGFNLVEFSIGRLGEITRTVIQCNMALSGSKWYKTPSYYVNNREDSHGYCCGIIDEDDMYEPCFVSYRINWNNSRGVIFTFENEHENEAKQQLINAVKEGLNKYIVEEERELNDAKIALNKLN